MRRLLVLLVPWVVALPAASLAQATSLLARTKADAESRAREEINDLLRTLCPEQCVLVSVEARVDEETISDTPPGFEQVTPGARVPVLRALNADVTVDSELPSAFRTKLKGLIAQRVKALGAQPNVNVEPVKFPPRNAPHLEKDDPPPRPPDPAPQAEKGPEAPMLTPAERAQERLAEAAPLLAIAVLTALALLGVTALLVFALRRASRPAVEEYAELPPLAEPPRAEEPAAADAKARERPRAALSPARERVLEKAVREERLVRNAVVRQALAAGEAALVARWVRAMGDFLLEDIRPDSAPREAIQKLAAELARPPAVDPADRAEALFELDGRLTAARLSRAADSAEHAFAFLEGVPPERFAAAAGALSPSSLEVAARFAPPEHRSALLARLEPERRQELALSWVRRPDVSATHAHAVADELRERVAESAGAGSQLERMVAEIVDTLPPAEQDAFLERLRREGDGRIARALVTEATLRAAPVDVLTAAVLALPPAQLVTYLSGAEVELRDQLLAACPTKMRGELREELTLRGAQGHGEFLAARRELLASLREEISRRGLDPAELRPRAGNGKETTQA